MGEINYSRHSYENLKDRNHLGDICVDERITLRCILKKQSEGMDWI
jgi:hypothetical protein